MTAALQRADRKRISLLGYVRGIGSGSTSPKKRLMGGSVTSATGPIDPTMIE